MDTSKSNREPNESQIPGTEPDAWAHAGEGTVGVQIPDWVRCALDGYATQEKAFQECEISNALNKAAKEKNE